MSAPALESFASNLYASVEPLTGAEADTDYALAKLAGALGVMFQAVDDLARDTPADPGWSSIMDLSRAPTEWLPWLGQFAGVTVPANYGDADARAWIRGTDGFRRGTPAAIEAAVVATLTGSKTVYFRERQDGDAYALEVVTITTQTPDPAATQAAIVAAKPGAIKLTYRASPGQDYQEVADADGTYADVAAKYANYSAMLVGNT